MTLFLGRVFFVDRNEVKGASPLGRETGRWGKMDSWARGRGTDLRGRDSDPGSKQGATSVSAGDEQEVVHLVQNCRGGESWSEVSVGLGESGPLGTSDPLGLSPPLNKTARRYSWSQAANFAKESKIAMLGLSWCCGRDPRGFPS